VCVEKRTCSFLPRSRSTQAEMSKTTSVYTQKPNTGETFHHEGNELIRSEKKIKQKMVVI